ncbi:MAG TPA: NAD(P)H-dependent oxidoreductase subunit E [Clostridiales bacterium]|nr:NAD(P)H-dependent oxidoreductase subunit E [Clostridiales bacterium]
MGSKTANTIPFNGTAEQESELLKVIRERKNEEGSLMGILQKSQDIYGYLPIEVQVIISNELNIPLEEIYGIVTFYSQFSLTPKGKYNVSVCLGTACYVKGAGDLYDKLKEKLNLEEGGCTPDGKFSLEACRCIGACGLAPVLTVNEDVYGRLSTKDLDDILKKYADAK